MVAVGWEARVEVGDAPGVAEEAGVEVGVGDTVIPKDVGEGLLPGRLVPVEGSGVFEAVEVGVALGPVMGMIGPVVDVAEEEGVSVGGIFGEGVGEKNNSANAIWVSAWSAGVAVLVNLGWSSTPECRSSLLVGNMNGMPNAKTQMTARIRNMTMLCGLSAGLM